MVECRSISKRGTFLCVLFSLQCGLLLFGAAFSVTGAALQCGLLLFGAAFSVTGAVHGSHRMFINK